MFSVDSFIEYKLLRKHYAFFSPKDFSPNALQTFFLELKLVENIKKKNKKRTQYTLLMKPNKVETAVQLFRMSRAVLPDFLVIVILFKI